MVSQTRSIAYWGKKMEDILVCAYLWGQDTAYHVRAKNQIEASGQYRFIALKPLKHKGGYSFTPAVIYPKNSSFCDFQPNLTSKFKKFPTLRTEFIDKILINISLGIPLAELQTEPNDFPWSIDHYYEVN